LVKLTAQGVEQRGDLAVALFGHRAGDELALAAVAVDRDHQPLGNRVGNRWAKVLAHQMEAEI
jgi:hypothetical protein